MKPSSWIRLTVFAAFVVVLIWLLGERALRISHHSISNPDHLLHTP